MNVRQVIKQVGSELAHRLRNHETIKSIEGSTVRRLASIGDLSLLISGCNRSGLGGKNVVQRNSGQGRYVAVLNPLDGHVNYLRGSSTFAASVSIADTVMGIHYSLLYDGETNEILEFDRGVEVSSRQTVVAGSRKPVVGIGEMIALSSAGADQIRGASLRSIGSTSLSILGVLRGHMDAFIVKTKMWNAYWALQLAEKGALRFENLLNTYPIAASRSEILDKPLNSLYFVCYRNVEDRERFSALISDFKRNYDLEHQRK